MYKTACRFMQRLNHPGTGADSLAVPSLISKGCDVSEFARLYSDASNTGNSTMANAFRKAGLAAAEKQ